MNVKFLNPFVEAAHEVLLAETNMKASRGDLTLEKEPYATDDVTVIISLIGRVVGNVIFSMGKPLAIALASRMMGEEFEEFNVLAQSGIAELGNVITGQASIKLFQAGYESTISPPTLIQGRGAVISTLDYARLIVPLSCDSGTFSIHLALRESTQHVDIAKTPVAKNTVG